MVVGAATKSTCRAAAPAEPAAGDCGGGDSRMLSAEARTGAAWAGKFISQHFSVNVDQVSSQELEDDLNRLANGRRPQFYGKMEDDLNFQ